MTHKSILHSAPKKHLASLGHIVKPLIKTTVSLTLMLWLLSRVNLEDIPNRWKELNWAILLFPALFLYLLSMLLRAIRLKKLLHGHHIETPIWYLSLLQLKANFLRNLIPGGISADVYKTYSIMRQTRQGYSTISSVVLEKIFGIVSILLLCIASILYGIYYLHHPIFLKLFFPATATFILIIFTILLCFFLVKFSFLENFERPFNFGPKLRHYLRNTLSSMPNKSVILKLLLISFGIQITIILWYYFVSLNIKLQLPLVAFIIVVPILEFTLILPISIAGIGVRETVLMLLLKPFGIPDADSLAFSLLCFFTITICRILSGSAFFIGITSKQPKDPAKFVRNGKL